MKQYSLILLVGLVICLFYSGCGGGGSNSIVPTTNPTSAPGIYTITGTIYDYDGELVGEGLTVELFEYEPTTSEFTAADSIIQTTKTDQNSRYLFRVKKEGHYWIKSISKDGITPLYSHLFEIIINILNIDIPVGFAPGPTGPTGPIGPPGSTGIIGPTGAPGATGPVDLATLRVYVYHDSVADGNEISGAEVTLRWYGVTGSQTENLYSSASSGNGYYEFTDLPMGQYKLEVNKDRYEPEEKIVNISTTTPPNRNIILKPAYPEMVYVNDVTNGPFYIGKYEVTNGEYKLFNSDHAGNWDVSDYPVEKVNWYDACDYCNWLSISHGFTPVYDGSYNINSGANGYRLPYEAEWEYACRAGTTTDFFWGDIDTTISGQPDNQSPGTIDLYCWYESNSGATPHEVMSLNPNPLGLYHMSGNVWEWCNDVAAGGRAMRGGSWFPEATYCQSNYSFPEGADFRISDIGFRLARNID